MKKYMKLAAFPAFFTASLLLISCTKTDRKMDEAVNFSPEVEKSLNDETSFVKLDAQEKKIIGSDKKSVKSPKKPEAVKFIEAEKEVKAEVNPPVQAEDPKPALSTQPEFIRKYNAGYLAFDVADIYLQMKRIGGIDESPRYAMRMFTRSNDFIDYLFGWRDHSFSTFRQTADGFIPETFKTKLLFKKKVREVTINYTTDGSDVASESVNPPDNRDKRPEVAAKFKKHTYDPLTIAVEARRMIIKAVRENNFNTHGRYNFSLPLYEARRRTDLMFNLDSKKENGLYHLQVTRKAVAGFTNNEVEDIKKGDVVINIYLDDKLFLPQKVDGKNFLGTATINFVSECKKTFEECVGSRK